MPNASPSFLRRLLAPLIVLVFVGSGGAYLAYDLIIAPRHEMERKLAAKDAEITQLHKDNEQLETYLRLLRHTERRARLEVLQQTKSEDGQIINKLRFTEVDAEGTPVGECHELTLEGSEVYVDMIVIKFDDHFVEKADPLKGHALVLLRRLFTNRMKPDDGYVLDKSGVAPEIYGAQKAQTPFEKELWTKFWDIANDAEKAKKYGVKAAHGQAVYGLLEPKKIYYMTIRSTGESSLPPPTDLK